MPRGKGDSALGKGLDPALSAARILAGSVRTIRRGCVMDVRMREVPARVVVTEQRTGPCRRRAGFHRDLRGQPERGRDGGRVLYPLHADGAAPDGAATRTIPAHREAYVRVLKRTVQSGAIGDVYAAIELDQGPRPGDWQPRRHRSLLTRPRRLLPGSAPDQAGYGLTSDQVSGAAEPRTHDARNTLGCSSRK
jgi:hypothetical protein